MRFFAINAQIWVVITEKKKTVPEDGLDYVSMRQGATRLMSRGNIEHSLTFAIPRKQEVIRSKPMAKPPWGGMPFLKVSR